MRAQGEPKEISTFLHNPGKYTEIGAQAAQGRCWWAAGHRQETLLPRPLARRGPTCPFFSLSGSGLCGDVRGRGAPPWSAELFKEAKQDAPCISSSTRSTTIGKSGQPHGRQRRREQNPETAVAGAGRFRTGKGVIVLGANNRPKVLDKLLRRGGSTGASPLNRPNLAWAACPLPGAHPQDQAGRGRGNLIRSPWPPQAAWGDLAKLVNEAPCGGNARAASGPQEDLLGLPLSFVIAGREENSVLTEFERQAGAYPRGGPRMVAYKQKNAEPRCRRSPSVPNTEGKLGLTPA